MKESSKRRLTDSVETALNLAGGLVLFDFVDLDAKDPGREMKFSEKMSCPNDHAIDTDELEPRSFSFNSPFGACPQCHGLGTRHGGRPRAGRAQPAGHPGRGRDPAVEPGARRRLLPAADGRARRGARLRPQHPVGGPRREGAAVPARRARDQGPRRHPQPVRPAARLLRRVRGRPRLHRAPAPRGRVRHQPRAVRGLHARGAVPRVQRQPPQAGLDGGHAGLARGTAARTSPRSARCRSTRPPTSCATST